MCHNLHSVKHPSCVLLTCHFVAGEVHGVFAQNELEQVVRDVREWVEASGVNPTREACYAAFIDRVRDNLHIALTMSPVGDAFRSRCV